ncbi:Protein MAIN-LIKE 2 [Glycine soja]
MNIMFRARGLSRTLGKVIGRTLGREVSGDADEAPQRRRPTTSALAPIVEVVEHVDHATDEVHEQPKEGTVDDAQGFSRWAPRYISFDELCSSCDSHSPFHSFKALYVDEVVDLLVYLLEVNSEKARAETLQYRGTYWTVASRAYLLYLVGCTLFANKSVTHVYVVFFNAFCDLSQTGSYAWRAVALVHMYEKLNDASKRRTRQLAEYIITLYSFVVYIEYYFELFLFFKYVQCWIYKHFPTIASFIVVEDYHERKPCACCWKSGKALPMSTYRKRLDRLMYGVTIPPDPATPSLCIEDIDDRWIRFSEYLALMGLICVAPG